MKEIRGPKILLFAHKTCYGEGVYTFALSLLGGGGGVFACHAGIGMVPISAMTYDHPFHMQLQAGFVEAMRQGPELLFQSLA